jgi:hypothetical protein
MQWLYDKCTQPAWRPSTAPLMTTTGTRGRALWHGLRQGGDIIEVYAARLHHGHLQIQISEDGPWRMPWACYREESEE